MGDDEDGEEEEEEEGSDSSSDSKKKKGTVKGKGKSVVSSAQSFSKRYNTYFGSKKFSDFTIKIGDEVIPAHKFILSSNSEFFEKLEGDSYTFPNEDDSTTSKSLIKYYYDGVFEYADESSVISFTILANKYKTKNFSEFKLPAKVLLNGIISYVEKDLNNRMSQFESLCDNVNFKKMEKEDLTKLYAKKKWLQKSTSFLNQIILKDMDDDDDESSNSDK